MNPENIKVEHVKTERDWNKVSKTIKDYCVTIEVYTLYRNLRELNLSIEQTVDLVTATLMVNNSINAIPFKNAMMEVVKHFENDSVYERALCRYFWVAGAGINKIMKMARMSQLSVYKVAYEIVDRENRGLLDSPLSPFITEQLMIPLDRIVKSMDLMCGCPVRPTQTKLSRLDVLRNTLKKDRTLTKED